MYDFAIVGGGIVGLATAWRLRERAPDARLLVLEKESAWAAHQTGHNSGVIHSGIYYTPGSLKARMAVAGNASMQRFCTEHGIPYETCGKVIVATRPAHLELLTRLQGRGLANGLAVERLTMEQVREHEPHTRALAGLWVPSTGIVSYRQVCETMAGQLAAAGCAMQLGARVERIERRPDRMVLRTPAREWETRFLINCAGLHSDRVAALGGVKPAAQIVPFRGEYFELKPDRRHLVRGLIYPVPNPKFPFLGVHLTRMIDGSVHAGPNAVLSLAREGYGKTDVNLRDAWDTLAYGGFWRLAGRHAREGSQEMLRSVFKSLFVRSLQELVPEIDADDLIPSAAGVRAQALAANGTMVDDFLVMPAERAIHVCNAPSPAATAALEIGSFVAAEAEQASGLERSKIVPQSALGNLV